MFLSSMSQEEFLDLLWKHATASSLNEESQPVLQETPFADAEPAIKPAVDDAAWMKQVGIRWREFWE